MQAAPVGRFPARQRVRKRPEFQQIQGLGRRVMTPHFALLVFARDPSDSARIGITVSRKVGHSVVRSRAKRLVREAFRATRDLWQPDVDLVVIVRKSLQESKLGNVVSEWRAVSRQITRRTQEARKDRERRNCALAAPR